MKFSQYLENKRYLSENTEINGFLQAVYSLGYKNPLNPREIVIDDSVGLEIKIFDNKVWIDSIRSFELRKGHATRLLKVLTELADKHSIDLYLSPKPFSNQKGIMNQKKLISFYEKFGFILSGEMMVRKAKPHNV